MNFHNPMCTLHLSKTRTGPPISRQTSYPIKRKCKLSVNVMLQSTLALWTPCYYWHPGNMDSCWIAGEKLQTFWLKQTPAITDLRTPLLVPTSQLYCSCHILAELSQIIIYFFLFLSSCLSLIWLKSKHSDSLLTWSFYETTVLTCKKQSWCT